MFNLARNLLLNDNEEVKFCLSDDASLCNDFLTFSDWNKTTFEDLGEKDTVHVLINGTFNKRLNISLIPENIQVRFEATDKNFQLRLMGEAKFDTLDINNISIDFINDISANVATIQNTILDEITLNAKDVKIDLASLENENYEGIKYETITILGDESLSTLSIDTDSFSFGQTLFKPNDLKAKVTLNQINTTLSVSLPQDYQNPALPINIFFAGKENTLKIKYLEQQPLTPYALKEGTYINVTSLDGSKVDVEGDVEGAAWLIVNNKIPFTKINGYDFCYSTVEHYAWSCDAVNATVIKDWKFKDFEGEVANVYLVDSLNISTINITEAPENLRIMFGCNKLHAKVNFDVSVDRKVGIKKVLLATTKDIVIKDFEIQSLAKETSVVQTDINEFTATTLTSDVESHSIITNYVNTTETTLIDNATVVGYMSGDFQSISIFNQDGKFTLIPFDKIKNLIVMPLYNENMTIVVEKGATCVNTTVDLVNYNGTKFDIILDKDSNFTKDTFSGENGFHVIKYGDMEVQRPTGLPEDVKWFDITTGGGDKPEPTPEDHHTSKVGIVVGIIVAAIVVIAGIVIAVICIKKRKNDDFTDLGKQSQI